MSSLAHSRLHTHLSFFFRPDPSTQRAQHTPIDRPLRVCLVTGRKGTPIQLDLLTEMARSDASAATNKLPSRVCVLRSFMLVGNFPAHPFVDGASFPFVKRFTTHLPTNHIPSPRIIGALYSALRLSCDREDPLSLLPADMQRELARDPRSVLCANAFAASFIRLDESPTLLELDELALLHVAHQACRKSDLGTAIGSASGKRAVARLVVALDNAGAFPDNMSGTAMMVYTCVVAMFAGRSNARARSALIESYDGLLRVCTHRAVDTLREELELTAAALDSAALDRLARTCYGSFVDK